MKKNAVQITFGIIAGSLILSAMFFLWQLKARSSLNARLEKAKKESKQSHKDLRRVLELKNDPTRLEDRFADSDLKIPPFELVPSGLMRQLFETGTRMGLKDIRFDHELNTPLTDDQIKKKLEFMQTYSGAKIELEYLIMRFKAGFQELHGFLRRLYALDRIVAIERLTVERRQDILPEQEVSLVLMTFMTNTTQSGR